MINVGCCACNEPNVNDPEMYSDHDELCKLSRYRCNAYSCPWCDYCDALPATAGDVTRAIVLSKRSGPRPGWVNWGKDEKPLPPSKEALDLPTSPTGSF